jgi:hypothetical protein
MQCPNCGQHYRLSTAPNLLCERCWSRSRGGWRSTPRTRHLLRKRKREAEAARLTVVETPIAGRSVALVPLPADAVDGPEAA